MGEEDTGRRRGNGGEEEKVRGWIEVRKSGLREGTENRGERSVEL
jgi:hypothetical protein